MHRPDRGKSAGTLRQLTRSSYEILSAHAVPIFVCAKFKGLPGLVEDLLKLQDSLLALSDPFHSKVFS